MQQLDPRAVWLFFISGLLRWLFILLFLGFYFLGMFFEFSTSDFTFTTIGWAGVILFIVVLLLYVWSRLSFYFYRYELTELGFRKELGVITKKYVTIPYDRIQNVDIYRGLLARLLGLSDLNIQTAGAAAQVSRYGGLAGGAEGRLPGLSRTVAENLRDELIHRAKQSKNQGL